MNKTYLLFALIGGLLVIYGGYAYYTAEQEKAYHLKTRLCENLLQKKEIQRSEVMAFKNCKAFLGR